MVRATILSVSLVCGVGLTAVSQPAKKPPVQGYAAQRVVERLNRGLIARPLGQGRVYLGWRLLDTDPKDVAFHVFRRVEGDARPTRLTDRAIEKTTDFIDEKAPGAACRYFVRPVVGGSEQEASEEALANCSASPQPYISIRLDGNHTFQKVAIADLDGDGAYDFVIKQPLANVDPYVQYWKKSEGTYKLEAYRSDGKFLWRYDMGWSIEQGMWYSPYIVYDFDGDGKAELACKAGEGDPRDPDGHVTTGPEYLAIMDGLTGKQLAVLDWPSREGFPNYNYYCRNQLGMAYLDGRTPCLIVQRGTYNTIKSQAYEFHGGKLRELWRWSDSEEPDKAYRGQGAHCLRSADIDGDGRDEVILGSAVLDDNGVGLWSTRMGHPDHVYIGDLDPQRPGLEIYYGMESKLKSNGMCMVDAATGKILWGYDQPTRHVHGQGLVADLDPGAPGVECYSADTDEKKDFLYSVIHDCKGNIIGREKLEGFAPKAAYWDADTQRELILRGKIQKYRGNEISPKIEGTVIAVADLFGDWREEIITSVTGELRIYTTTIPATDRRVCLMRDPIYRNDVATASQGYYQIPTPRVLPGTER